MRPIEFTTAALATADEDGIAEAQTLSGAGAVDLDGVLVTDGVAVLASPNAAPRYGLLVTITSSGDDSGVVFTVTGTAPGGAAQSENVTGESADTASTTLAFETVTGVEADGATDGDITVGAAQAGATAWLPLDIYTPNCQTAISVNLQGSTLNYSVVYTNEDPFDLTITQLEKAHPNAALTGASTSQTIQATALMRALRFIINSGNGTARVTITQQSTQ